MGVLVDVKSLPGKSPLKIIMLPQWYATIEKENRYSLEILRFRIMKMVSKQTADLVRNITTTD